MRALLVAVLFCLASGCVAAASTGQRIALIIGNSNYVELSALQNPENDARAMAGALEALGFDVILKVDADRRGMARAIRDFGRQLTGAGTDSVGLFFYAGHGVQAGNTNYLMPLHAEVVGEADLEIEAVDANWVLRQMEEAGNALNIIILDACRNNPFRGSFRSADRGLARINAPTGSIVAYSAAPGQVAADGDGENSPYTAALIEAMQEPGIELSRVFRQVRVEVTAATGGDQTPWEEQSLTGDFFFVPEAETQVAAIAPEAPSAAQPAAPAATAPSSGGDTERLFWNTVMNSTNPAELQAYLDAYPNGTFRVLAEIRIANLQTGADSAPEEQNNPPSPTPPASVPPPEVAVPPTGAPGWLGARVGPVVDGLLVITVASGGPADQADIRQGDVIRSFDGRHFSSAVEFAAAVAASGDGVSVVVEIDRNGQPMNVRANLDAADGAAAQRARAEQQERLARAEDLNNQANRYNNGDGVALNLAEAARLYGEAAELGSVDGQFNAYYVYRFGEGVDADQEVAAGWVRMAAAQGDAEAQNHLGEVYEYGEGVPQSNNKAFYWFQIGAHGGDSGAQFNLARFYDFGFVVPTDLPMAYMWYSLSQSNGYPDLDQILSEVGNQLSSSDISSAKDMASLCLASNYEDCGGTGSGGASNSASAPSSDGSANAPSGSGGLVPIVHQGLGVTSALQLDGAAICMISGPFARTIADYFTANGLEYYEVTTSQKDFLGDFENAACDVIFVPRAEAEETIASLKGSSNYVALPEVLN